MGKRGPPPLPTALKVLKGTFRRSRAVPHELAPMPGVPTCPPWFDKIAKAEWARIVPELAASSVLSVVDGAALEGYCANYALAVRYQRLANKALTIRSRFGTREPNSAASAARKHWALARQFASEFGLTPSARTRISMPTKKKENKTDTEKFLFGTREEQTEVMDRWKKEEQAKAQANKPDTAEPATADDTPASTPEGRNSVN